MYVYRHGLLHPQWCQDVIDQANQRDTWETATIQADTPVDESIRKTQVQWLEITGDSPHAWLGKHVLPFAEGCSHLLGIEIWTNWDEMGFGLQLAHYAPGDFYHEHVDTDFTRQSMWHERKMSVVIPLTEHPTLNIKSVTQPPGAIGSAIAFPSYAPHFVPPADMDRYSLVGWFLGDRWR